MLIKGYCPLQPVVKNAWTYLYSSSRNCDFELKNGSGFWGRGFIAGARYEPFFITHPPKLFFDTLKLEIGLALIGAGTIRVICEPSKQYSLSLSYRGDDTWDKIFFRKNLSLSVYQGWLVETQKNHLSVLKNGFWEYVGVQLAVVEYPPITDRLQ